MPMRSIARLALLALVATGCVARSYRPTRPAVGWDDAIRVRVEHLDVVGTELTLTARVAGDAQVGAVRFARGGDEPCRAGALAKKVLVDGIARTPNDLLLEGERVVEATFVVPDLEARLHQPSALDLDTAAGCVRVPLVRGDGVVEWVEEPEWSVGGSVLAVHGSAGELGWGGVATLGVARLRGRLEVGGAILLGRTEGRGELDHVDLMGITPSAGLRLLDVGSWALSARAGYDLIAAAGSSPTEKEWLPLIHGPRLFVRAGYGGGRIPWRAFRTRRSATMFGLELGAARWVGGGWVTTAGLVLELGR